MNRNVSIVVVLLVLVVIAGYLVWLRSRIQSTVSSGIGVPVQLTPTPASTPVQTASPSATPSIMASSSAKPKTATPSSRRR